MSQIAWEPYQGYRADHIRISETSCCGAYEWACQGGHFLILRYRGGRYEETGRGLHRQARAIWDQLLLAHVETHAPRARTRKPRTKARTRDAA